jgi:4-alpha-glucanotransferase
MHASFGARSVGEQPVSIPLQPQLTFTGEERSGMNATCHLCLVLHNHQPIGNFDGVFQQAYEDSYLPFLEIFEPYEELRISLHTSGPLMLWLHEHHPEYMQRLRRLVAIGRIEVIGGPLYEPILTMLPKRDRVGQIRTYSRWLKEQLGGSVQGMWMPERVWESALAGDCAEGGISYTVLDDFHFKAAGLTDDDLTGYFLVEEDGRLLRVFPGSEHLRYTIPFQEPAATIDYARECAMRNPGCVLVFGDDGEKFGVWPNTKKHVYEGGWLRRFFDALVANRDWLITSTLADAIRQTKPVGKAYLPDCSYREMTEWALPVSQQLVFDDIVHRLEEQPDGLEARRRLRGGFWRNFKVKYSEANEMYSRMMAVSRRLATVEQEKRLPAAVIEQARDHLYRGQCNCPYWHGAFGGIYLPHLRNAIFHHLIAADDVLDHAEHGDRPWVEVAVDDFDFDGNQEVRLSSNQLIAWLAPARGGQIYELDVRGLAHNVLATMQRRPEAYHRKVLAGPNKDGGDVASIHDLVVFKQEGLDERLQYDRFPRKTLVDHFYDDHTTMEAVRNAEAIERGDFAELPFEAKLRRATDRIQVQMRREGNAWGIPITITKAVTMVQGAHELEVAYLLENVPSDRQLHFGIELNFSGLPAGADDRYFSDAFGRRMGQLGTPLDLHDVTGLGLTDEWLGINVRLNVDRSSGIWAFPIETVSQSESGFELVHQSVCVQPHWLIRGDASGRWSVTMRIALQTRSAATVSTGQVAMQPVHA